MGDSRDYGTVLLSSALICLEHSHMYAYISVIIYETYENDLSCLISSIIYIKTLLSIANSVADDCRWWQFT